MTSPDKIIGVLTESGLYLKQLGAIFRDPYRATRLTRITSPQAVFWVCTTATLVALLEFPIATTLPSLVPGEHGWDVLLDTPQDRSRLTAFESLVGTVSIVEIACLMLMSALAWVVSTRLLSRNAPNIYRFVECTSLS